MTNFNQDRESSTREVRQEYRDAQGNIHTNVSRTTAANDGITEAAYRDGYVNGQGIDRDLQYEEDIREKKQVSRGLLLGSLLTGLVGLTIGAYFHFTDRNREVPVTVAPVTVERTAETATSDPGETPSDPTTSETRIIERTTQRAVPVPQPRVVTVPQSPAPAPSVNVNIQRTGSQPARTNATQASRPATVASPAAQSNLAQRATAPRAQSPSRQAARPQTVRPQTTVAPAPVPAATTPPNSATNSSGASPAAIAPGTTSAAAPNTAQSSLPDRTDASLRNEIINLLQNNLPNNQVTVIVQNGVATVTGFVATPAQARQVEGLIRQVQGVSRVDMRTSITSVNSGV